VVKKALEQEIKAMPKAAQGSSLAALALALAEHVDMAEHPTAAANASKEYRAALAELRGLAAARRDMPDTIDTLRLRVAS
jgi:hypothetical protein